MPGAARGLFLGLRALAARVFGYAGGTPGKDFLGDGGMVGAIPGGEGGLASSTGFSIFLCVLGRRCGCLAVIRGPEASRKRVGALDGARTRLSRGVQCLEDGRKHPIC